MEVLLVTRLLHRASYLHPVYVYMYVCPAHDANKHWLVHVSLYVALELALALSVGLGVGNANGMEGCTGLWVVFSG